MSLHCHSVTVAHVMGGGGGRVTDMSDSHCTPSDTVPALEITSYQLWTVSLSLSLAEWYTVVDSAHSGSQYHVSDDTGLQRKTTEEDEGSHLHSILGDLPSQAGVLVGLTDRPQQAVGSLLLHTEQPHDPGE